jgi:hypothetical protein
VQPGRDIVPQKQEGGMLDFGTLQKFVMSLGPEGKVELQDTNGSIVEASADVPDIHELIEVRATHFKIMDRPWVTREDFMREFDAWERSESL